MIEIVTPASSTDLTTFDAVSSRIGAVDLTKEEQINQLIKYATDLIQSYCHQIFAQEKVKETLPGFGMPTMSLERAPIVSIESAAFNGVAKSDVSIYDNRAGLIYCDSGFENTAKFHQGITATPVPNSEELLHEIIYTGGYILPSMDSATRNLPYDIEEAAIEIVRDQYE
ncbi:MAG: hypothetical protein R3240_11895, partial [Gammaproteobacteria bacterium]|nr:hypothetical protein [Gammaproteobacteria bacterium]